MIPLNISLNRLGNGGLEIRSGEYQLAYCPVDFNPMNDYSWDFHGLWKELGREFEFRQLVIEFVRRGTKLMLID